MERKKILSSIEPNYLQEKITYYQGRIETLKAKIWQMQIDFKKSEDYCIETTRMLEKQLVEKQHELKELKTNIKITADEHDEENLELRNENERLKNRYDLMAHQNKSFKSQEKVLMEQLIDIKKKFSQEKLQIQLKAEKQKYIKASELWNQERDELNNQINDTKATLAQVSVRNSNLENEEIETRANEKAVTKFQEMSQDKIMVNKKLKNDLQATQQELQNNQDDYRNAIDENKTFKTNFALNQDGIKKYQSINYQQSKKIRKLKEKIEYLKNYISEEVSKYLKEIEYLKYQKQTQETESDYQLNLLRDKLKNKNKETKTLKAISQMILDQRSDIELFFLEALDQVREEIRRKRLEDKNSQLFPDIHSKGDTSQRVQNEKVDIAELDWEDRERVLRLLFSKINTGVPPVHWRQVPDKNMEGSNYYENDSQFKQMQNIDEEQM